MTMNNSDRINLTLKLAKLNRELDRCGVSHILHLILSVITGGFWLIVWAVLVDQNKRKTRELENDIDETGVRLMIFNSEI